MLKCRTKIIGVVLASMVALSGCSAVTTAVKKRNLEVKTQMSETIWLDPVSSEKRTVFVQVRNTTDKQIDIAEPLKNKLSAKGYHVVSDPDMAHYWIQTNVLKLDKMDLREAQGYFSNGYGAGISGAALGALTAGSFTSNSNNIVGGALIGTAVGLVADAMVEDVNYALITDVQIVEKSDKEIETVQQGSINNGSSASTRTTLTTTDNKKRFQTRILSNANQVNLDFEDAKPVLVDGLATSISGVF
ncbi:complement resistance protein TraT [Vibrio mediterranei]|uniref:complement resistance protein TraT n=1 Tax=Vibrio mediterranei TaxID=689 RepID=UPI001EFCA583|nr:complement resistance protein TraT [Vibrio mediterranei]MCG9657608.1 complement resistance protein TraT [Vibrio mediterranei]